MKTRFFFAMLFFGTFALTFGQSQKTESWGSGVTGDYSSLYLHKGAQVHITIANPKAGDMDFLDLNVPDTITNFELYKYFKYKDGVLHFFPNSYINDTNRCHIECSRTIRSVTIEPGATLVIGKDCPMFSLEKYPLFTLLTDAAGDSGKIIFEEEGERTRILKFHIRYEPADSKKCAWEYEMAYMQFQLRAPLILSNPRYENPYNTIFLWDLDYAIKVRFKHTASRWDFSTGLGLDMRSAMLSNQVDVVDRQLVFSEKTDHNRFSNSLFADYLNVPIEFSRKIGSSDDFSVVLGITPAVLIWEGYLRNDINENNRTKPSSEKTKVLNPWRLDIHAGISISYFELGIYGNPLPTYRAGVGGKPLREFGFYLKW